MDENRGNDLESLQRDVEEARARVAATAAQLQNRLSPPVIAKRRAAAIKGAFVDPVDGTVRTDLIKNIALTAATAAAVYVLIRRVMS